MVPLLPTQPLSLASGLLFGGKEVRAQPHRPWPSLLLGGELCMAAVHGSLQPTGIASGPAKTSQPYAGMTRCQPPLKPPTPGAGALRSPCCTQGAALMLVGVTLAAVGAFSVSRTFGRGLAERVIAAEVRQWQGKRRLPPPTCTCSPSRPGRHRLPPPAPSVCFAHRHVIACAAPVRACRWAMRRAARAGSPAQSPSS